MKEELLRVLNTKLDDINANIDSLNELNNKIDGEEKKISYIRKILNLFKKNEDYDILNFANINKDDFEKILEELGDDVRDTFSTNSCNYDGLVYLINGINSGVSLTLTDEQEKGIKYLIHSLDDREVDYEASIDGLQLVKARFPISDVSILSKEKDDYNNIILKLNNENYVSETDKICEAIKYSKVNDENTIKMLSYLLEYNADVYQKGGNVDTYNVVEDNSNEEEIEKVEVEEPVNTVPVYEDIRDDLNVNNDGYEEFHFEEFNAPAFDTITKEEPVEIKPKEEDQVEEEKEEKTFEDTPLPIEPELPENDIDNDFVGVVETKEDYEEEKVTKQDLQKMLKEYDLKDEKDRRLLEGSITNYREVLDTLKSVDLYNEVIKNHELLVSIMLYSSKDKINKILDIVRNDLSVDQEDYDETKKIIINTIPIIFAGGYDNFIENIHFFKQLDVNLVNLFDFSKEVLVVDNKLITDNYDIVSKYNVKIDYKNAKYFLVLSNIEERMDYYVESVYPDKTKKNEMFDGLKYLSLHPAKLNTVGDLTIKRLRYASENGKKVFGAKPNSLNGEITNLKVNSLEIPDDYLQKYFDNHFANLTGGEIEEYTKYIHDSKSVNDYNNELKPLNKYHKDLRYCINDINISYNKVVRDYNILRSHDVPRSKALEFAVCYNLVITKDEYDKLANVLNEMGGND